MLSPMARLFQLLHARNARNAAALEWVCKLPGDDTPGESLRSRFDAMAARPPVLTPTD